MYLVLSNYLQKKTRILAIIIVHKALDLSTQKKTLDSGETTYLKKV
jgi:hypothetical protein